MDGGQTRGGISGELTGLQGGVAIGASEVAGSSRLVWHREIDCDLDECE